MLADVYLNEFECWLMFILWKPTSNEPSQALSVAIEYTAFQWIYDPVC